jgi:non-specific serine/threonine protein kinase
LTGAGGIGKTRLLEEAYARFGDEFERGFFIDLVTAHDQEALTGALEEALLPSGDGFSDAPKFAAPHELLAQLAKRLGSRRTLLALDNCEQLLDVLPQTVTSLLGRAPTLTILATSRERLGIPGETVIVITPLALPSAEAARNPVLLRQVDSVELLVRRVRDGGGDVAVTAETAQDITSICRNLDGIPLALELAAPRLQSTSIHEFAARLPRQLELLAGRSADPRHRTLRSTVEWSYDLLEPSQRVLLGRLGIFLGGFTLDAAEEICSDARSSRDEVYLNLAELVSKSLVIFDREQNRYRLLEPIRQFARELLEQSLDVADVAERHAHWALRESRAVLAAQFLGNGAAADEFKVELDNVHAAIEWLFDRKDETTLLRLVAALGYTWFLTDWRRGRIVADRAVALAPNASLRLRAAVLLSRGIVEQRADPAASRRWLSESRSLYVDLADDFSLAWATFFLARSYDGPHGDVDKNEEVMAEAAARFHRLQVDVGEAWALTHLALIAKDRGRTDRARDHLERALTLARNTGQNAIVAMVLAVLGWNAFCHDDIAAARGRYYEAVELSERGGDRWNSVGILTEAALVEAAAGQVELAEGLLRRAVNGALEVDDDWQLREALLVFAVTKARQKDVAGARSLLAATGWDVEPPLHLLSRGRNSLVGGALHELDELLNGEDRTPALAVTVAPSPTDMARLVLSTPTTPPP